MATVDEIKKFLSETPHPEVKVAAVDVDGVLRGKYMSKEKFAGTLEKGFGFCDVVFGWDSNDMLYDNSQVTGWHTGYPDTLAIPDPATFRKIPWEDNRGFILGDFYNKDREPLAVCPRNLLKKVIKKANVLGCEPFAACEFEYFLFEETPHSLHEKNFHNLKPLSPGMFGYSILRSSARSQFVTGMVKQMEDFNCPIEGIHTETGPGVFEAALQYGPALEAADRAALFKTGVKELANKEGLLATFMAKWNGDLPGCSGHIHLSLWDEEKKKNLLFDAASEKGISKTFEHFLAGLLHCMQDFTALYSPTINSFKRYVPGLWSPLSVTWGIENRTTALRVISDNQSGSATRVEQRQTAADINPYIAMAATLGAGLYGIEKKLELKQAPIEGNAYDVTASEASLLPNSLEKATERLSKSDLARDILGEDFVNHYVRTRDWECREYRKAVTDWELKRYFEII